MSFVTRAYNNLTVSDTGAFLIKESSDARLHDELTYYRHLPEQLKVYFPRLIELNDGSVPRSHYNLCLEYYAYPDLGKKFVEESIPDVQWKKIFEFFSKFARKCSVHTAPHSESDCVQMFVTKTEREQLALQENPFFAEICKHTMLELNGKPLRSFEVVWPTVRTHILEKYCKGVKPFSWIHGDCCFGNILYGHHEKTGDVVLKFIDPRGSFGQTQFYGDFYYDLAKLSHSCNGGYEYFINDAFNVETKGSSFELSYMRNDGLHVVPHPAASKMFKEVVQENGYDEQRIRTLEGTIFVGMCARHYDSLDRQKAMYITGLKILNEIYEEILL